MQYRSYRLRGTPDCPVSVYTVNIEKHFSHWHPEVEIMMLFSGNLHCQLEDQIFSLNAGDILIINPNQFHREVSHSENYAHMSVIFSTEIIAMPEGHIFQKYFVAPLSDGRLQLPNLVRPDHPVYRTVYDALQKLAESRIYSEDSKLLRYTQIATICAALQPYCTLTTPKDLRQSPDEHSVQKAILYIHNLYATPLTLEKIAAHIPLHPTYLCKIFKAQTGHTVMEHLAQTRVDAAKFLLRRDALPMARVAELSGFPSERSFYRQFKAVTGITPKTYQKQQLQVSGDS